MPEVSWYLAHCNLTFHYPFSNIIMRALIVVVLGLVIGVSAGRFTGLRNAQTPEDHFGPFSDVEGFTVDAIEQYSSQAIVSKGDGGAVEVVGNRKDYNFGVMQRNAQAEHRFQLKNVGTGPLNVRVTGSTCKCTVGRLKVNVIQPGEVADVNLTWTARSAAREFSQTATIETSDPDQSEVKLSIHGTLVDTLVMEPESWEMGKITSDEPMELRCALYGYIPDNATIVSAEFLDSEIQDLATIDWKRRKPDESRDQEHVAAKWVIDFDIKVAPGLKLGGINHTFRIRYESDDQTAKEGTFDLKLGGTIVGPMRLIASKHLVETRIGGGFRYYMGTLRQGEALGDIIRLIIRGEEYTEIPIEITEIQPENVFDITMGKEIRKQKFRMIPIKIRVKPDAPLGKLNGHLTTPQAYAVIKAAGNKLSPLKLWLTVDVIASGQ